MTITFMTFEEAKAHQQKLYDKVSYNEDNLKKFDEFRNSMGLVPDHIRETQEYQTLKNELDKSFAELRKFNGWYVKSFKKELAAERKNKYTKRSS